MTKAGFHRKFKAAIRILIGSFFIITGVIITPMPIPLGLLMIAFGIILFAYDNNRVIRHIRIIRRRFPGFSSKLEKLEQKNIWLVSDVLRQTNPANAILMKPNETWEEATQTDSES